MLSLLYFTQGILDTEKSWSKTCSPTHLAELLDCLKRSTSVLRVMASLVLIYSQWCLTNDTAMRCQLPLCFLVAQCDLLFHHCLSHFQSGGTGHFNTFDRKRGIGMHHMFYVAVNGKLMARQLQPLLFPSPLCVCDSSTSWQGR